MGRQRCGCTYNCPIVYFFPGASSRPPQVDHLPGKGGREALPVHQSSCNFGVNWRTTTTNGFHPNLLPDVFAGRFLVPAREKEEVDILGLRPAPQSSGKVFWPM